MTLHLVNSEHMLHIINSNGILPGINEQEAHGPHHSPEKQFQSINTL